MGCSAAIEAGIFISQGVWLLRTRSIRRRAKECELKWEDSPEAQEWQENRMRIRGKWTSCLKRKKAAVDEEFGKGKAQLNHSEGVLQDGTKDDKQCNCNENTKSS